MTYYGYFYTDRRWGVSCWHGRHGCKSSRHLINTAPKGIYNVSYNYMQTGINRALSKIYQVTKYPYEEGTWEVVFE